MLITSIGGTFSSKFSVELEVLGTAEEVPEGVAEADEGTNSKAFWTGATSVKK